MNEFFCDPETITNGPGSDALSVMHQAFGTNAAAFVSQIQISVLPSPSEDLISEIESRITPIFSIEDSSEFCQSRILGVHVPILV